MHPEKQDETNFFLKIEDILGTFEITSSKMTLIFRSRRGEEREREYTHTHTHTHTK